MKTFIKAAFAVLLVFVLFSCNTLYNSRTIDLEIFVPARVIFPEKYDTIAVRFNNINADYNPNFATYFENKQRYTDSINTDSVAAETYYKHFLKTLKSSSFFDTIVEIERQDYSNIFLSDSLLKLEFPGLNDSLCSDTLQKLEPAVNFWSLAGQYQPPKNNRTKIHLDPELGLYSAKDLTRLADSSNARLLLSLDYFAAVEMKTAFNEQNFTGVFNVFIIAYWNFYDPKNLRWSYFYDRVDTLTWNFVNGIEKLPPREEAIQKAAEISGNQFAEFLIPHWIEVQRIYYQSGQIDLKKTDALVAEGKWLEAAEIWRKHVENPNKNIAAKCKFNMALACEMLGQLDAAVDWAVQSYHVFGQKNPVHEQNSLEYINILNQRKLDIKRIEYQFNPKNVPAK